MYGWFNRSFLSAVINGLPYKQPKACHRGVDDILFNACSIITVAYFLPTTYPLWWVDNFVKSLFVIMLQEENFRVNHFDYHLRNFVITK